MTAPQKSEVVFPPMDSETEAKVRGLLRSIGEFMDAELVPQIRTIMTVPVPPDRFDVYTVLDKISLSVNITSKKKGPSKGSAN
jgi:hypothetical protein